MGKHNKKDKKQEFNPWGSFVDKSVKAIKRLTNKGKKYTYSLFIR